MRMLLVANKMFDTDFTTHLEVLEKDWGISNVHVVYINHQEVPFSFYECIAGEDRYCVDSAWLSNNITPLTKGYDVTAFVLDKDMWMQDSGLAGWFFTERQPYLIVVKYDEGFDETMRHEMGHAYSKKKNVKDRTHEYLYRSDFAGLKTYLGFLGIILIVGFVATASLVIRGTYKNTAEINYASSLLLEQKD